MLKILIALLVILYLPGLARAESFAVALNTPAEVKAVLESNMGIFPELQDEALSSLRFDYLVRRAPNDIRAILMTEGYYSPSIDIRLDDQLAHIDVDPGPPSRISDIHIEFQGAILDDASGLERKQALTDTFLLRPGMQFRNAEWAKAKESLMLEIHSERFPAAKLLSSQATVDPETQKVVLSLLIDSGPAFLFGELEIEGLNSLPASIISGVNRIVPGSVYRERDLNEFQSRLQLSGYFRSVFVSISTDAQVDSAQVPVRVNVVESLARRVGLGIGYSTDMGAGVEARYEDNLTIKPGWRSRSSLKLYQREQSVQGEFFLTPLPGGLSPRLDARIRNSDIQNDHTYSGMLGARLIHAGFDTEWHVSAELYKERKELSDQLEGDLISLPINFSWTRRVLDNPLFPRKGYSLNLQAGGAAEELISDSRFLRVYGKSNLFWPVGKQGTLILKGELGAVEAENSHYVPDDYLFRAGGTQSVRGYEYGSLGVEQNGAIVPGQYMAVASMEYMHHIKDDWYAAIFYDAGNVVNRWQDFSWVQGYGVGARWKSPLGSLNADLAYGEKDQGLRLHLSVGLSF